MQKIHRLQGPIVLAGTPDCPSTFMRLRCPRCYALLPPFLWKHPFGTATKSACPVCKLALQWTGYQKNVPYLFKHWRKRGIAWTLFYVFAWLPVILLDEKLRLARRLYFAVLRLFS